MMQLKKNISLAKFSNYKIGGSAQFFFEPATEADVCWAVKEAKAQKLAVFILGGGTNLLIDDRGWKGLVLRPKFAKIAVKGNEITVDAGASIDKLLKTSVAKSLSGLEWAGGLPGLLGGAIRGNAGCFGGEIKDVVASVRSFDMKTMKFVTRTGRQCGFGYRTSVFKKNGGREIILSATLKLAKGNKKKIAAGIKEKIDYRKRTQPLEYPNIGSIFKNVPLVTVSKKGSAQYRKALGENTLLFRGSTFSVKKDPFPVISAAKLIAESGLRGANAGGAQISTKHPNFIVNVRKAGSPDVQKLMKLAKQKVRKKFGVQLEEEVQII